MPTTSEATSTVVSTHGYTMRMCQPPKKVTHRTSGRKRVQVDYTQFDIDEPSSPPKKQRKVDLKRRPSKTRIAAEKYKTKLLGEPRPVRKKAGVPKSTSTTTPVTMTPIIVQPTTSWTVTVAATEDETQTAIAAMLSLGTDLPPPDNDCNDNAALVLLVPHVPLVPTSGPTPSQAQNAGGEHTVPVVIGTAVKTETKTDQADDETNNRQKKKTFVTMEYKLKRKYVNTK